MRTRYFARVVQHIGIVAAATAIAVVGGSVQLRAAVDPDVQMCHAQGNGGFHLININGNAEPAHRAHGDAGPGEPVPGDSTLAFDAECNQVVRNVDPTMSCLCWKTYTQSALLTLLTAVNGTPSCAKTSTYVSLTPDRGVTAIYATTSNMCVLRVNSQSYALGLTAEQTTTCMAEATAIAASINWCPQ
jgi:hypothetical protein